MNWLAHLALSTDQIDFQLGNVTADVMKCKPFPGCSDQFIQGIKCHREIDRFTDQHELFRESKYLLPDRFGLLRGILVDLFFDHFLSIHWDRYYRTSLNESVDRFIDRAIHENERFPDRLNGFLYALNASNRLKRYGSFEGLQDAILQMSMRCSQRVQKIIDIQKIIDTLQNKYDRLRTNFLIFYPQLQLQIESSLTQE